MFYNIEGYRRFYKFHSEDISKLRENHFIRLYETWCEDDLRLSVFSDYEKLGSKAVRQFNAGRSSGGIALFFKPECVKLHNIIKIHQNIISARFTSGNTFIIVLVVYVPPPKEHDKIIDELNSLLNIIGKEYANDSLVVGGDFNGRVGGMQQDISSYIFNWGTNESLRSSKDHEVNGRGELLMETCNENDSIERKSKGRCTRKLHV